MKWTVVGDPCYRNEEEEITLNINACREKEFNCHDGFCVDINQRCDGKVQCPDKSGKAQSYNMNDMISSVMKPLYR